MSITMRIWLGAICPWTQIPLGYEVVGIFEVLLVVVDSPKVAQDCCSLRDKMAIVVVVCNAGMWSATHHGNRSPSERLLDDSFAVGEILLVTPTWRPISADNTIQFFLCLCSHSGETSHREHEAHQCRRRSVASCTKQRTSGICNLPLGKRFGVLLPFLP